jgi:dihydrolipoyl dehydrogenase
LVEHDKVGGTCLHRGCVPAKEFLETATVYRTVAGAAEFGVNSAPPTVDFAASLARKQKVVDQLWKGLTGLLKKRGVTIIPGWGRLRPGRVVEVVGPDGVRSEIAGQSVVLAAGSAPRTIPGFDVDGVNVHTSDSLLDLESLPGSVAIIGGGAIGCEFASMMSDLGTRVTLLEMMPRLLPGCDGDVVGVVARSFAKRGIDVRAGVQVTGYQRVDGASRVLLAEDEPVDVEAVVVSVGRRPLTDDLLTDGTGVIVDSRGFVEVDPSMRTTDDGVYAVGDLVDTPQLAHVAFAEAIVAITDMLGEQVVPVDYGRVPWGIYCHPEVAFAGHSEESAREAGFDVMVKKDPFGGNSRARIMGETDGMVKVIAERAPGGSGGRILGVHMVGPLATELLAPGYLSVNWDATAHDLAPFVQPHPTLTEVFGETVMALTGRGLHVG